MPLATDPPDGRPSARAGWSDAAGCLAYLLIWPAVLWAPGALSRHFGALFTAALYLLLLLVAALVRMRQIHRRGQTVPEAFAAARSERQRRAVMRRRARQDAAALPWLNDPRLRPADQPGVLISPAPDAPLHFARGYDVVLDSAGGRKIQVIQRIRKLTQLPLKEAKDLVDGAPVPVLRVPDMQMAIAAMSVLEAVGASVSIADPG
jgi:Ribosomal protein L7/L12 C-terminal domain